MEVNDWPRAAALFRFYYIGGGWSARTVEGALESRAGGSTGGVGGKYSYKCLGRTGRSESRDPALGFAPRVALLSSG